MNRFLYSKRMFDQLIFSEVINCLYTYICMYNVHYISLAVLAFCMPDLAYVFFFLAAKKEPDIWHTAAIILIRSSLQFNIIDVLG